jgi:hypothetical protein
MQGSVYVEWLNKTQPSEPEFAVSFIPYETIDGATDSLKFLGEETLRTFLALSLSLETSQVQHALSDLRETGSAEIEFLTVSDDDLRRLKLV